MNLRIFSLLALFASSCNDAPIPDVNSQVSEGAIEAPIVPGTKLEIEAHITGDPAKPVLAGTTNLPSGTELNVMVVVGEKVRGQADLVVKNHKFEPGPMGPEAGLLPGKYEVELGSPLVEFQPPNVRAMLGREYENLSGPYFNDDGTSRQISYKLQHVVPGFTSASAKARLQEQDDGRVRDFAHRTCIERQTSAGKATRTPRAIVEIEACTDELVADIRRPS